MVQDRIAARYAKGVYELAEEKGAVEALLADFTGLQETIQTSRDLQVLLHSPVVAADTKRAVLRKIFTGRVHDITSKLMDALAIRHRENLLRNVAVEFIRIYNEHKNITPVSAISSTPLTEVQLKEIADRISKALNTTAQVTSQLNPDLIGGVVLNVRGMQYDGSVAGALRKLQKQLAN